MRGSKRLAPARMVQILGVRLRGAARLFHAELEDNIRTNWEELTAAMAHRFDQPHRSNLHKTAFRSRKKKPEETLLDHADDLRRLVNRANPNAIGDLRDELARDRLIEAIPSAMMRLKLKEGNFNSLDAVVQHALHLEALWGAMETPLVETHSAARVCVCVCRSVCAWAFVCH